VPVVYVVIVVAVLTTSLTVAYWAGTQHGRSSDHAGCIQAARDAEGYARECEHEAVYLRMQVRGLTQQLTEHGVGPWTSEDDTPPAPIRGRGRRVLSG
jgi:hypothetical protein